MRVPGPRTVADSVRYGFAVGKVRALETRIFGRATYERLLDAPTLHDQLRVLSDTHYGRFLEGARTARDVERGLDQALDGFYGFLEDARLPSAVVRFFRLRHDYANLKALLKARALDVGVDDMLSTLGTVPAERFEEAGGALPEPLAALYARLSAEEPSAAAASDLTTVDFAVDRAAFKELLEAAHESGSDFLVGLARLQIDVANLKAALRARLRGLPAAQLQPMLLSGGGIRPDRIMKAYVRPAAEIAEVALGLPLLREVGVAEFADPERLDVVGDDIIVRYLRAARLVAVGAEPVIAYVMAREAEVVALRILLVGRLAGVRSDALRDRLRDLYV